MVQCVWSNLVLRGKIMKKKKITDSLSLINPLLLKIDEENKKIDAAPSLSNC